MLTQNNNLVTNFIVTKFDLKLKKSKISYQLYCQNIDFW